MASIECTKFIALRNSNSSLAHKLRVYFAGFEPVRVKSGRMQRTVTGHLDNQVGPVIRHWRYNIKVYAGSDPGNPQGDSLHYGTREDLRTFFEYNDPAATPSNVLSLWVHGQTYDTDTPYTVYLVGTLPEHLVTFNVTAGEYSVPVEFAEADPV